jgi:hypothetical protein
MERIAMSQEERDKLERLKRASDKGIRERERRSKIGVSDRWVRKLLKRMKKQGDRVVVHGLRGSIYPQDNGESAGPGAGDSAAAGLARLRANLRERAVGEVAWHRAERQDSTAVDDRSRVVEQPREQAGANTLLAAAAQRLWRTGAVGTPPSTIGWKGAGPVRCLVRHRRRHQRVNSNASADAPFLIGSQFVLPTELPRSPAPPVRRNHVELRRDCPYQSRRIVRRRVPL